MDVREKSYADTFDEEGGVTLDFAEYLLHTHHKLMTAWEEAHPGDENDPAWIDAYHKAMVAVTKVVTDTALHGWRELTAKEALQA